MPVGSNLAGVARVAFVADTGQFNAEIAAAEARYARTTGVMSDDAIRLTLAQDKLNRALSRFGPESAAAQRATLALRSAQRQAAGESDRLSSEVRSAGRSAREAGHGFSIFGRQVERAGAGAVLGTRAFHGLRQSILLGGVGLFGGFGASFALKAVLSAAKDAQVANAQLRVSLKDTGNSWGQYGQQVTQALEEQSKASGFTNHELTTSLSVFVRRFGDVNQALRANALAAEVARGKNEGLAQAQDQVLRASFGNPRAARQLGVEVAKVTTNYDQLKATTQHATAEQVAFAKSLDTAASRTAVLDAVQARFHGNAARFLTTSAGKQALFNAELRHSEEIIGTALLPAFNQILGSLSKYLDRMNRTHRLQHDVNRIVHDGTVVFHGFRSAIHAVNDVTGSTETTLKALAGVFVAMKLGILPGLFRQISVAISGVGTAAATAAPEVNAFKTAEERPNFGPGGMSPGGVILPTGVTPVPTGAGGPFGRGTGPAGGLKGGAFILPGAVPDVVPSTGFFQFQVKLPNGQAAYFHTLAEASAYARAHAAKNTSGHSNYPVSDAGGGVPTRPGSGAGTPTTKPPPGDPTSIPIAIQQMLADAGLTPKNQADDRKAYEAEVAFVRKQLATAKLTALQRLSLTQQLGSDISAIQSIDDQAASAAKTARDAAARKRAEKARKAKEARARAAVEAERRRERSIRGRILGFEGRLVLAEATPENNDDLAVLDHEARYLKSEIRNKELALSFRQSLEAKLNAVDRKINTIRKKKSGITSAVQAQAFTRELSGILGQFASNVSARPGSLPTGSTPVIVQNFHSPVSHFAAARAAREAASHYPI